MYERTELSIVHVYIHVGRRPTVLRCTHRITHLKTPNGH